VYEVESATPPPQKQNIHEKVTDKPGRVKMMQAIEAEHDIDAIDFEAEFADDDEIPVTHSEPQTPAPTVNSMPPLPKNKGGWLPLIGLAVLSLSAAAVLRWTIDGSSSTTAAGSGSDENVATATQPAAQALPVAVEKGDAGTKP
jgi:hypothetical protein